MPFVYILLNKPRGKTYTGSTMDLERRLKKRNSGKNIFTKRYVPWVLFHYEKVNALAEARKREKYLKSSAGRKYIKKLFNHIPV